MVASREKNKEILEYSLWFKHTETLQAILDNNELPSESSINSLIQDLDNFLYTSNESLKKLIEIDLNLLKNYHLRAIFILKKVNLFLTFLREKNQQVAVKENQEKLPYHLPEKNMFENAFPTANELKPILELALHKKEIIGVLKKSEKHCHDALNTEVIKNNTFQAVKDLREALTNSINPNDFRLSVEKNYNILSESRDKKIQANFHTLLTSSLSANVIDITFFKSKFKFELEKYSNSRKEKAESCNQGGAKLAKNYNSFFGRIFGFSAKVKTSAAENMMALLDDANANIIFSDTEISALRESGSELAKIITKYEKLGLLPNKFIQAENNRYISEVVYYHAMK